MDEIPIRLTEFTNRSREQTEKLFLLCDRDVFKLIELEFAIWYTQAFYCPDTKEEIGRILFKASKKRFMKEMGI